MSNKGLIKSTGTIGAATALSRVLGFVRDVMFANFFGTDAAAQAFVVAFRIPNTLRDLVGEGAMNSAIVPVLSEYRAAYDRAGFGKSAKVLFNISLAALSALTVIGIIFSPLIVRITAPGFAADPEKLALTIWLNRVMFPYLLLIGLTAYSMGVLNTMRHFAAPAFGPAIMNVAMIASFFLCPRFGVMALAAGVLAGGALQLLVNLPAMYRRGIGIDLREGFRHPAVKRIGALMVPRAMGSGVYQINIFVDTILASLAWVVGAGGVAALYYANRLIQFPLGIFSIAMAQAALPKMSQEFASRDTARFKETLSFSLRAVFLIMLPAGFALAILGRPVIRTLFERGEFTAYSTAITESALFFYAIGLMAFGGVKLLVTAFYAMHDTLTPVKTAFTAVAVNIALSLILMWPLKLGGLALATSISAAVNFTMLYTRLRRRIGDFGTSAIAGSSARVFLASCVMGLALKALTIAFPGMGVPGLLLSMAAGAAIFIASCYAFDVREIKDSWAWISARR
jgi:putative peptidoglycan lipid II flippase